VGVGVWNLKASNWF